MELLQFIDTPLTAIVLYAIFQREMAKTNERISRIEGVIFGRAEKEFQP